MLYQMLTGNPPFAGAAGAGVLAKLLTAQPERLEVAAIGPRSSLSLLEP
ncbi:MAG: hypothetical protein ACRENP_08020 [Longimicrobiales bacterium]